MRRKVRSVQGRGTHGQSVYPYIAVLSRSMGLSPCALGARNPRLVRPHLKGNSRLSQVINKLKGHLSPLSEPEVPGWGRKERQSQRGIYENKETYYPIP